MNVLAPKGTERRALNVERPLQLPRLTSVGRWLGLLALSLALAIFSPLSARAAAPAKPVNKRPDLEKPPTASTAPLEPGVVPCGNLIYAGTRSSICFADKFLGDVAKETTLKVEKNLRHVRLDSEDLFNLPFCIFSGEDPFTLSDRERKHLRAYLLGGGFVLSSPSCSNTDWDKSLRKEISLAVPEAKLTKIPMTHSVFGIINKIQTLRCKEGNTATLEGLEINGRLVMIHSTEGLNDVHNAKGCCCCGGNEILDSARVNVNIFTYALLY